MHDDENLLLEDLLLFLIVRMVVDLEERKVIVNVRFIGVSVDDNKGEGINLGFTACYDCLEVEGSDVLIVCVSFMVFNFLTTLLCVWMLTKGMLDGYVVDDFIVDSLNSFNNFFFALLVDLDVTLLC